MPMAEGDSAYNLPMAYQQETEGSQAGGAITPLSETGHWEVYPEMGEIEKQLDFILRRTYNNNQALLKAWLSGILPRNSRKKSEAITGLSLRTNEGCLFF